VKKELAIFKALLCSGDVDRGFLPKKTRFYSFDFLNKQPYQPKQQGAGNQTQPAMDTHGNGFGYGGSYTNNNTNQGHAGHGHNDYGGSNGPRRTYTPITSASSIFMPSLKRCVNTLDMSTQLVCVVLYYQYQ
jgi:hypothetical protein